MEELETYSLIDFMPMEPEVYLRLFVRQNEAMWPFQIVTVALGLGCIWLARREHGGVVGVLLGAAAAWVGYSFFLDLYAELNWAATYVGWAFITQGVFLAGYGLTGRLAFAEPQTSGGFATAGLAIAAVSLLVYPFIVPLGGRSWGGIEVFGASPDPTALAITGFVLAAARVRWLLLLIPVLWCAYSGLTSLAMGWPLGLASPTIALLAVGGAIWKSMTDE
jgi:hypothetical protein